MATDDIQGTITDEAGSAIEGAVVALIPDEGNSGDSVIYDTTDANGDFLFDGHPQGDGTTQEWHVVAQYEDGGGSYNTLSKPNISASLPEGGTIPDKDSFGDQNLDEWTGDTTEFGFRTDIAFDGSVSLEHTVDSSHHVIWWDESIDAILGVAKTASLYLNTESDTSRTGVTLVNSSGSGYLAYFDDNGGNLSLATVTSSGFSSIIESTSLSASPDTWYKVSLSHDGSDGFDAVAKTTGGSEIASLSVTDGTYDNLDRFGIDAFDPDAPIDLVGIE